MATRLPMVFKAKCKVWLALLLVVAVVNKSGVVGTGSVWFSIK